MPRSFSRTLADRFRGNRGYFRNRTPFEAARWWLTLAVALGAGAWLSAKLLVRPEQSHPIATHGPVAKVHAMWDAQCDACHTPAGLADQTDLLDAHSRWHQFTCEKCHTGNAHHPNLDPQYQKEKCSNCHHDHNGRDFLLTKIGDEHCTRCHNDVKEFRKSKPEIKTEPVNVVTNFANEHPIFKPLEKHERQLKFNHALHLTPGMPYSKGEIAAAARGDRELYTFQHAADLGHTEVAKRYGGGSFKPEANVVLTCQSCHEPAGDGKYFKAVNYEQHCAACHPNEIAAGATAAGQKRPKHTVPHGKPLKDYEEILQSLIANDVITPGEAVRQPKAVPVSPSSPEAVALKAQVKTMTAAVLKTLESATCAKCHDVNNREIVKPIIPTIWFTKAKFSHTAHRSTDCTSCHSRDSNERVGVNDYEVPRQYRAKFVDIQGIDNCRTCHAPAGVNAKGQPIGGVAYGCVECHGFHDADKLHRRAAESLKHSERTKFDIYDFLRGKGKE